MAFVAVMWFEIWMVVVVAKCGPDGSFWLWSVVQMF